LATSATLELFKEADRDGDGAVNFDDFVEAIRSHSLRLDRRQASSQQRGI
jgi:Ca2+-binding EF-hand superfamily protein